MPNGEKYLPLSIYLESCKKGEIQLSFLDIEEILGFKLPISAYNYSAWWSNNPKGHTHALAWLNANYATEQLNLMQRTVIFKEKRDKRTVVR